jgi:CRISP-associated protein Cas1
MLKRTLVFTHRCKLTLKNGQMCYCALTDDNQPERIVALEDIGFVILENQSIIITTALMQAFLKNNTAVVVCDETHHPCAMLQNFDGNTTHSETLRYQIEAGLPLKKRMWKDIVTAKIKNQAQLLELCGVRGAERLKSYAAGVKSGDSGNREGQAARYYWNQLFGHLRFKRERDGAMPNALLNYGYAILRAAAARALVCSGLYCAIGIHHHNRYNSFCLVDDFMEPYRPFVDRMVHQFVKENGLMEPITPDIKRGLLEVLTCDTVFEKRRRPLMIGLSESSAALVRCFKNERRTLCFPTLI